MGRVFFSSGNDGRGDTPLDRCRDSLLTLEASMIIYLIGSLRNPLIPEIGNQLRAEGHDVYDDWFAGGREADDEWQRYEGVRGREYLIALNGWHARQVFQNDLTHLDRCDAAILVLPAGKSGHLELGYIVGLGKTGYILLDNEPDRFDVMYRFANGGVYTDLKDIIERLPMTDRFLRDQRGSKGKFYCAEPDCSGHHEYPQ